MKNWNYNCKKKEIENNAKSVLKDLAPYQKLGIIFILDDSGLRPIQSEWQIIVSCVGGFMKKSRVYAHR